MMTPKAQGKSNQLISLHLAQLSHTSQLHIVQSSKDAVKSSLGSVLTQNTTCREDLQTVRSYAHITAGSAPNSDVCSQIPPYHDNQNPKGSHAPTQSSDPNRKLGVRSSAEGSGRECGQII